jgi:hypothetical protein
MGQFEFKRSLVTGSAGALARMPWPGILSKEKLSRFALNAGEVARVPSNE